MEFQPWLHSLDSWFLTAVTSLQYVFLRPLPSSSYDSGFTVLSQVRSNRIPRGDGALSSLLYS